MSIWTTRSEFQAAAHVLERAYFANYMKAPPIFEQTFNVWETDEKRSFAQFLSFSELGLLAYKPEGGTPRIDRVYENILANFSFFTMALGWETTEEAQLEDPVNILGMLPGMLAQSEILTYEFVFWNMLNLGFSLNAPIYDGQPLFSNSHPLGPIPSPNGVTSITGQTYSNYLGAVALSPESLYQADLLFQNLLSDRALPVYKTPVDLIVPSSPLAKIAEEVVGTPATPWNADNTKNTAFESKRIRVSRYLTSPQAWFIMAAKGDLEGDAHGLFTAFKWRHRIRAWTEEKTGNFGQRTSFRATFGPANWRGAVGSYGVPVQ